MYISLAQADAITNLRSYWYLLGVRQGVAGKVEGLLVTQSASARPGRNLEAPHAGTAKLELCRSLSSRASDLDDLFADPRPSVTYKLRIITGDLRGAGTSEEIMIQVHCASRPLLRMYARAWPSSYPAAA